MQVLFLTLHFLLRSELKRKICLKSLVVSVGAKAPSAPILTGTMISKSVIKFLRMNATLVSQKLSKPIDFMLIILLSPKTVATSSISEELP